jgi:signal transduction histidine kinase
VQSELEQNELIAWQKLTRVITHEIMNSAIPISNLSDLVYNQLFINDETFNSNLNTEQTEDIKEGLKTIESRSKALVKFVDATRNFTKMPKPELEMIQVDMILQKVLSLLKVRIEETDVEVKVSIKPDDLKLLADSSMLEQVLINITLNAIDSYDNKNQNKLEIIAEKTSDNHINISISDNGKGIEPNKLDHIFIPFFTTKINGSGIGLSLSKQIMYLHKGNISVKSEPGKGTTFVLTF